MTSLESRRRTVPLLALSWALAIARFAHADEEHTPSVAVLETYGPGMPPPSVLAVTRQLYATIARLGYRTTPEKQTAALTMRLGPRVLAPPDLLTIASHAHAEHAVQATLSTEGTRYVVLLTVANADRTDPRFASDAADAAALESAVDGLGRTLFPAVKPTSDVNEPGTPAETSVRFALQTEAAFGVASHFFYNHFAGGRLDYGFTRDFALGAYVGYANLKGREGRVSEVLPYLQLEYRMPLSASGSTLLPLRFGTGYLPKNGPFLRVAAGPSFALGGTVRLGMDLIAPTFVIVHDRTVVSMDVAVEVSFAL